MDNASWPDTSRLVMVAGLGLCDVIEVGADADGRKFIKVAPTIRSAKPAPSPVQMEMQDRHRYGPEAPVRGY